MGKNRCDERCFSDEEKEGQEKERYVKSEQERIHKELDFLVNLYKVADWKTMKRPISRQEMHRILILLRDLAKIEVTDEIDPFDFPDRPPSHPEIGW